MFCVNCGSALSAGAGPGAPAAPMYPGAMPGLPSAWESDRQKQIGRTKTGLLLLLIGFLMGWLPRIGIIGGLLILVGAILVILGRKAFGSTVDTLPLLALQDQLNNYTLLNAIPSLLFAGACYLAWSRVNRGEIPAPTVPPGMPATPPAPLPPR